LEAEALREAALNRGAVIAPGRAVLGGESGADRANAFVVQQSGRWASGPSGRPLSTSLAALELMARERAPLYRAVRDAGGRVTASPERDPRSNPEFFEEVRACKILEIYVPNLTCWAFRSRTSRRKTYGTWFGQIESDAADWARGQVLPVQPRGAIVDEIQAAYGAFDGIDINPAATPIHRGDSGRAQGVGIPAVEVHLRCGRAGRIQRAFVVTAAAWQRSRASFQGYTDAYNYCWRFEKHS
jgi:3-dehydroquinate dehydratase